MYINLCSNFDEGDKIYIFGFSRGAVAARILANMISECVLLGPEFINYFDKIEEIYFKIMENRRHAAELEKLIEFLNEENSRLKLDSVVHQSDIDIEIVGVLDTVSGRSKEKAYGRYYLRNFELARRAKVGLQFLSIDESRPIFAPHVWNSSAPDQYVEQIWVPGVHSDIGGYFNSDFISNVVLLTLIERMRHYGIKLDFHAELLKSYLDLTRKQIPSINNERVSAWKLLGFKKREIKLTDRKYAKNYISGAPGYYVTLHPIFYRFFGKEISVRGKQKIYKNNGLEKLQQNTGLVTYISPLLCQGFAASNHYNLNEVAAS